MPMTFHLIACSRSASAKIILGLLPPSSSVTFLRFVRALASRILRPTRVLPVKATLGMRGCSAMVWPTVLPYLVGGSCQIEGVERVWDCDGAAIELWLVEELNAPVDDVENTRRENSLRELSDTECTQRLSRKLALYEWCDRGCVL